MLRYLKAALLGLLEGATEFLHNSKTGHLIIAADLMNFTGERAKTFEIFIQLGAILAIVWHYRVRVMTVARDTPGNNAKLCARPTLSASCQRMSSTCSMRGVRRRDSIQRITNPPSTSADATEIGLNKCALMVLCNNSPCTAAGKKAMKRFATKRCAAGS